MSARILQFPIPGRRFVRVERDRTDGEWLVIFGDNAWPVSSRADAMREADEIAAQFGVGIIVEAPR